MKPSVIVLTEHAPESLDGLIAKAAAKGQKIQRASDFLKFNANDQIPGLELKPVTKRNVYGVKETETAVPSNVERTFKKFDLADYLPEGM